MRSGQGGSTWGREYIWPLWYYSVALIEVLCCIPQLAGASFLGSHCYYLIDYFDPSIDLGSELTSVISLCLGGSRV